MTDQVTIRNLTLGEGIPKICIPVMGKDSREVLASARAALEHGPDILELRADFLEHPSDAEQVCALLAEFRAAAGDVPVLFTFRTKGEGGERELPLQTYEELLAAVCASGTADAVDVELFLGERTAEKLIREAHAHGVRVILSSHDFEKTPPAQEITGRLRKMQELGADVAKIAAMPRCEEDVLTLLSATLESRRELRVPIITMSMGALGMVSRLLGETFGSALTFGMAGRASAPGQIPARELRKLLQEIHHYSCGSGR